MVDEYLCVARGSWNVLRIRRMTASDWRAPRTVTKKRTSAPRRTPCVARGQEATTLWLPNSPLLTGFSVSASHRGISSLYNQWLKKKWWIHGGKVLFFLYTKGWFKPPCSRLHKTYFSAFIYQLFDLLDLSFKFYLDRARRVNIVGKNARVM